MRKQSVRYPWDVWLKRARLRLRQGEHFCCQPHSMGVQIRNAAARRGIRVSVYIQGKLLIVVNHKEKP